VPIALEGYTLKNVKSNEEFKFPDITLPAGGNTRVWFDDSAERPAGDLFWDTEHDRQGGSYVLMDGAGKKISVQDAMPMGTP